MNASWRKMVIISFCLLLTSCSEDPSRAEKASTSIPEQVLHIVNHVPSDPTSLDPLDATDPIATEILSHVMEGLVRVNANGQVQPGMAKNWEISQDGLTYTFHLRQAKWTNGDPVTAADFEYEWKRMLDPVNNRNAVFAYQLYYLKNGKKYQQEQVSGDQVGVKAIDDRTLQVQLERPTPYFISLIGSTPYLPTHQKVVEKDKNWTKSSSFVGNGPFTLKVWEPQKQIVLEKNINYWNQAKVNLAKVHYPFVLNAQNAYEMYKKKEVNYLGSEAIPPSAYNELKKAGKLKSTPVMGTYMYFFNTAKPPFNNAKIRKAFSLAIDRTRFVSETTQEDEMPAISWIPWKVADPVAKKDFNLVRSPYLPATADPNQAKQLLTEGLKEVGLKQMPLITIDFNTNELYKKQALLIKKMWKQYLGVDVELREQRLRDFYDRINNGEFQVARLSWSADYLDPLTFAEYFTSDSLTNKSGWHNLTYDQLIKKVRETGDQTMRMEALHQAEDLLMKEAPIAPIYFYTESWVWDEHVKNITVSIDGRTDYTFASID